MAKSVKSSKKPTPANRGEKPAADLARKLAEFDKTDAPILMSIFCDVLSGKIEPKAARKSLKVAGERIKQLEKEFAELRRGR